VKIFGGICALVMQFVWVTVHNVLLLSHCLIACSLLSFVVYFVLINYFNFFNYSFYVCCLGLCVLLSILRVLCFYIVSFVPMYRVVYFVFLYNFTVQCHQVETQFQLINIISYIISYQRICLESLERVIEYSPTQQ